MGLGTVRKTALVTGAAGFVGSHLVDRLLAESFEVVGLDSLMTGDLANLSQALRDPHFHFEVGDIRNPLPVYAELVFNLACPASPVHYQRDPYTTLTTSVLGAQRLVQMARGRSCTLTHASAAEVYGDPQLHPQPESYWGHVNPLGARACYDEGKRCAETLLIDAGRRWGIDVRILRIFNTYGPRMALDDGRVISSFVLRALKGQSLEIFGDGLQRRSFCYVADLIEGIIATLSVEECNEPINLGSPQEITIAELAKQVIELSGSTKSTIHRTTSTGEAKRRCPDIARARKLLGFEPRTQLRTGLELTIVDFARRLRATDELLAAELPAGIINSDDSYESQPPPSSNLGTKPNLIDTISPRETKTNPPNSATPPATTPATSHEQSLSKLADLVSPFSEQVTRCGNAYRIGQTMAASEQLIAVADTLQKLTESIAELPSTKLPPNLRQVQTELWGLASRFTQAQQRDDTIEIADLLEYELTPLLQECQTALRPQA